jgi:hypothetical protein
MQEHRTFKVPAINMHEITQTWLRRDLVVLLSAIQCTNILDHLYQTRNANLNRHKQGQILSGGRWLQTKMLIVWLMTAASTIGVEFA